MIQIGRHLLPGRAVLAPMAGVTDGPFRQICKNFGAALTTGEMTSSNPALRRTLKSKLRTAEQAIKFGEAEPVIVQIAGTEPQQIAEAARYQADLGAQIVDINMGCRAKKVCRKLAGSSLLRDESLVAAILKTTVAAVDIPVTLKIRTGWSPDQRNAAKIARIAEDSGISSLAVHGRTRACRFLGQAEYDTIAEVVHQVNIPVFANGDITSSQKALEILNYTGANGVMIGRAAQGRPWIFSEINNLLGNSQVNCGFFNAKSLISGDANELGDLIINHILLIEQFYSSSESIRSSQEKRAVNIHAGVPLSVKIARKHVCWYFEQLEHIITNVYGGDHNEKDNVDIAVKTGIEQAFRSARKTFNRLDNHLAQQDFIKLFCQQIKTIGDLAA